MENRNDSSSEEVNLDVRESSIVSLDNGITTTRLHVAALKIQTFARVVILQDESARRRDSDSMFYKAVAMLGQKHGLKSVARSARERQRRSSRRHRYKYRASKTADAKEQGSGELTNGELHPAPGDHAIV